MPSTVRQGKIPLDWLNFFLADVRDGLGPYLAIYLLTVQEWDEASIGVVMSIGGIAAILAQTPAGALIDNTKAKRALIIGAAVLVTLCCVMLPLMPDFIPVAITQAVAGAAGSVFQPVIAAITLGMMGPKAFTKQTGRNEAFNHAGNAVAAVLAGGFAFVFGPIVVFYLMAITTLMSACIVAAQLVMVPVAMLVGAKADVWGRKPIFLAGFLVLPLRGILYTLSDNPYWLVGVQALDGVGAGIFGALFPVVVNDLTKGTGHFNVSQGAITTALGIGAALSTTVAGVVVVDAGYSAAFLTLAAIAGAGLALFWIAMPETQNVAVYPEASGTLAVTPAE